MRARRASHARRPYSRPAVQFLAFAPLLVLIVAFASHPLGMRDADATAARSAGWGAGADSAPARRVLSPAARSASTVGHPPMVLRAAETAAVGVLPGGAGPSVATAGAEQTRSVAVQQQLPIFYEHRVVEGETVSGIAAAYGVSTDFIVWNNIDILDDADMLAPGVVLQVPSVDGLIHSVRVDETVSEISARYDVEIAAIVGFAANGLAGDPDNLREGTLILVPGARPIPVAQPAPASAPEQAAESAAEPPAAAPVPAAPPQPAGWLWPATGRITNTLGPRHPLGIDISMVVGTPIIATAGGQAVFVGGNACCSYGSHVILDHGDGYETLYAHLSRFAVSNGEWVAPGQVIGWSGNSGRSTGPHLHFELRRSGVHLDPLSYLP